MDFSLIQAFLMDIHCDYNRCQLPQFSIQLSCIYFFLSTETMIAVEGIHIENNYEARLFWVNTEN